jgi:hypothetical protein
MGEFPRAGLDRRPPGQASREQLEAIKAAGRARIRRLGLIAASVLTTVGVVGIAGAVARGGPASSVGTPPTSPTASHSRSVQEALDACLQAHGVTISNSGHGVVMSYPNHTDPSAPTLDDLRYACQLHLQEQGYPITATSPDPGPDITQVLELRFKPGTYTRDVQARVDACYLRPGVTPLPRTAPSPPSQRFRWIGNNVDEGRVIFGCLGAIPGVVVVDLPAS